MQDCTITTMPEPPRRFHFHRSHLLWGMAIVLLLGLPPCCLIDICDGHFDLTLHIRLAGGHSIQSVSYLCCSSHERQMAEEIAAIPGAADESAFLAAQKTPEGFVAAVNTSCRINGWGVESSYYRPSYMVLLITGDDGGKIRKLVEIPKRSEPPSLAVSVP